MVGKTCTVCKNFSYSNKNLSFFSYPGDPKRRNKWLKAIGRLDLTHKMNNNKTRANHRICERHFEPKYIRYSGNPNGRKYLTKEAVPTLHLYHFRVMSEKGPIGLERFLCNDSSESYSDMLAEPTDLSEFCESVIKVSNGTQTLQQHQNKKDDLENKRKKLYEVSITSYVDVQSPESWTDLSEFCESVMKVSKETQTVEQTDSKIKSENSLFHHPKHKTQELFMQKSEKLSKIIKYQLNCKNDEINTGILLALNLYYSGNAYTLLKRDLNLPQVETLKKCLVPKTTKLCDSLLSALKAKVKNMSMKERICSVAIRGIKLEPYLYYDIKYDRIIGLHDVNGRQTLEIAEYAIVLTVQGIVEDWVQPISYMFISQNQCNTADIDVWVEDIIAELIDIGLEIKIFVPDLSHNFLHRDLKECCEEIYFTVNDRDIFYLYDVTQMRDYLNTCLDMYNFCYNDPSKSFDAGEFLKEINKLCDMLNAKSYYSNAPYKRAFCNKKYQTDFLNKITSELQNLKVLKKSDSEDVTKTVGFIYCFIQSIKSLKEIYKYLHALGSRIMPTHCAYLNHYINRFFGRIKKSSHNGQCTARLFTKYFVRSFVFNLMKKPVGPDRSCPENELDIENYSQELMNQIVTDKKVTGFNTPLKVSTTDYRQGLPEKNVFVYICGYLYFKCLQNHCCEELQNYSKEYGKNQKKDYAQSLQLYHCMVNLDLKVKNRKILPPDKFNDFIMTLERKFREYFKPDVEIFSVGHEILQELEHCEFDMPCPCFPVKYLKTLFIRVRIFYTIRKNNRLLRKTNNVRLFNVFKV